MCASPEVLFPFSVNQPYRNAWSVPRSRLSRFDITRSDFNQPLSIGSGELSLRFSYFANRINRFLRPGREFSHPDNTHGIWSFAVLFLSAGRLLFPSTIPHLPLMT